MYSPSDDMNILVDRIENTGISPGQVVALLHESFEERLQQGLRFTCSSMTEEQYRERTKDAAVFVAVDRDKGCLAGTAAVHIDEKEKSAYYEYMAVAPGYKGYGIASLIFNKSVLPLVESSACDYVMSDTAAKAESSVRWHRKQGFKVVGYGSYPSTNYYSYIFRKQLSHPSKWDSACYSKLALSYWTVRTRLIWKADGTRTLFGRLVNGLRLEKRQVL